MALQKKVFWLIHNKLENKNLEVSHFQQGEHPKFEKIPVGQTQTYQSSGADGRISLRVHQPDGYRVAFGENVFTGWIEIDPRDKNYNTLIFPNGSETEIDDDTKEVTVTEPE